MTSPSPAQIRDALRDYGVPVKLYAGWDTIGRPWSQGGGLLCTVTHHTATASATGSSGAPSLAWCATAYSKPAANMLIGRGRDDVYLLSAGSCYHSGNGGPSPKYGAAAGNTLHPKAFGIELDDPGRSVGSLTEWQVECNARVLAAIQDVAGLKPEDHYTHTCWTNLCHGMAPAGTTAPYYGRKNDTLGDSGGGSGPYSAPWWRAQAARYSTPSKPTNPDNRGDDVPTLYKIGKSKFRAIYGDRLIGIPESLATKLSTAYGIPVVAITEEEAAALDKLGSEA